MLSFAQDGQSLLESEGAGQLYGKCLETMQASPSIPFCQCICEKFMKDEK